MGCIWARGLLANLHNFADQVGFKLLSETSSKHMFCSNQETYHKICTLNKSAEMAKTFAEIVGWIIPINKRDKNKQNTTVSICHRNEIESNKLNPIKT